MYKNYFYICSQKGDLNQMNIRKIIFTEGAFKKYMKGNMMGVVQFVDMLDSFDHIDNVYKATSVIDFKERKICTNPCEKHINQYKSGSSILIFNN